MDKVKTGRVVRSSKKVKEPRNALNVQFYLMHVFSRVFQKVFQMSSFQ